MKKKSAAIAMSGGVDSSVGAVLLQQQGYEVIGITLQLAEESRSVAVTDGCTPGTAVEDAGKVCRVLGIEHHVFDLRKVFAEQVVGNFLAEYAAGRTPNPCVLCNKQVKFGALLARAAELGADYLATGHYARIERTADGRAHLLKGLDESKDQSYVLYQLEQQALQRVLLPLGGLHKNEVRQLAEKFQLPVAHKAESQEICFIPDDDYAGFMRQRRPEAFAPGEIVDKSGKVVGRHQGLPLYTVGQRKGLGIYEPEPRYVIGLDAGRNKVIVGKGEDVFAAGLIAGQLVWTQGRMPETVQGLQAKIRYGRRWGEVADLKITEGKMHLSFATPQRAITPGQSVVIYCGDEVLGGGIIEASVQ